MGWGAGDDGAAQLALVLEDLRGEKSVPSAMGSPPPAMMIGFFGQILWPLSWQFQEKGPGNRDAFLATLDILIGVQSILAQGWQIL